MLGTEGGCWIYRNAKFVRERIFLRLFRNFHLQALSHGGMANSAMIQLWSVLFRDLHTDLRPNVCDVIWRREEVLGFEIKVQFDSRLDCRYLRKFVFFFLFWFFFYWQ